ncbi:nitric oxide synthase oxygenase [Paenibacillus pasadenensis]|uniref:nitric oxide synthase oxygenase n=1 Tax=Paenibacillus TaxID=44249 RepID=UPI000421C161|nr:MULTISPECIES: nitric oxide synthase oxygenase [Paenibacillus]QGG56563.1 nitric oxide synthase oxygenase [Paenibacillus sp. B01]
MNGGSSRREEQAEAWLRQFGMENGWEEERLAARIEAVRAAIGRGEAYEPSAEELVWGARVAWRNNSRCIGRLFWQTLDVIDARGVRTEEEAAGALLRHLETAANGGRIRSVMTVFPSADSGADIRVWNHQLLRYAGYPAAGPGEQRRGDPASDAFTALCLELGWRGTGGDFDLLPLVVSAGGGEPRWFPIPAHLTPEVAIEHPEHEGIGRLGLRWYAVPIISDMALEIGGTVYPAAPFNGWYMETEIGARNFGDPGRYDRIAAVADALGLDRSSNTTLWKDRAIVELNIAVLHSFRKAGVSIVDHHTAADQFVRFQRQEAERGRETSARWSWLIPPLSPSLTPVWHDAGMRELELSPRLLPQDKPARLERLERQCRSGFGAAAASGAAGCPAGAAHAGASAGAGAGVSGAARCPFGASS